MNQTGRQSPEESREAGSSVKEGQSFVLGLWGVRYQIKDVSRSVAFYTQQLVLSWISKICRLSPRSQSAI